MCATKTADIEATVAQVEQLAAAGAGVVRIAVDTPRDCEALAEVRRRTSANLSVDLQENYRLAAAVAPLVDKIRYNPGHLYHHERARPWQDKVRFLVDVAGQHDCALRVGVNCGSVDPAKRPSPLPLGEGPGVRADDPLRAMLESALEHCDLLDRLGFTRYCVSLKDSDPAKVVEVNRRFAAERPEMPLHLGVTEAGMPPEGISKRERPSRNFFWKASAIRFASRSRCRRHGSTKRSRRAGRSWPIWRPAGCSAPAKPPPVA